MEEECEHGLPSGTCLPARRLEVVAVAGLLWIYFVVCFLVSRGISFFFVFFTSIAHGLLQVRGNRASGTFLLVMRQGRGSEATETVFKGEKKPHHTGVRARCHYLIFLSVCVRAFVSGRLCKIRCFYGLRELYEADFHKLGIYGSGRVWANARDVFHRTPSRGGRGRRAATVRISCVF